MFKKSITYEDYNGQTVTEDFYFNLTKIECMEIEFDTDNHSSLSDSIKDLIDAKDMATVIRIIKRIVLTSYGVKSSDGKRFIKSDELRESFEQSPAFEELYWSLVTNSEEAASFIAGIVPQIVRDTLGDNPKEELLNRMKASMNEAE